MYAQTLHLLCFGREILILDFGSLGSGKTAALARYGTEQAENKVADLPENRLLNIYVVVTNARKQRSHACMLILIPPCMPKFVRTATSHWYRCVHSLPKLLILLLRSLPSGEIRHFYTPSFFVISPAKE